MSRPTVRAALTRLAAVGLVETRQGGGSRVRDFREHGLDLLPRLLLAPDGLDLDMIRDVVEARTVLDPQIAGVTADRRPGPGADARLVAAAGAVDEGTSNVARQRAAVAFWEVVVDRSGSIVFRLLYNQLRAAFEPVREAIADVLAVETDRPELFDRLAAVIVAGERERAVRRACDLPRG